MSDATERLQAIEKMLVARGVLDVKFFFDLGVAGQALSEVKDSVARVLEAHCDEKFTPLTEIGDRHLAI